VPWLLVFLTGAMIGAIARWVIFGLGFGFIVFRGLSELLDLLESMIKDNLGALPSTVVDLMAVARLDVAISIILAAYGANLSLMVMSRLVRFF